MALICDFWKCRICVLFLGSPLLTVKSALLSGGYYQVEHLHRMSLRFIFIPLGAPEFPNLFLRHTRGCVNGRQSVRLQPSCIPKKQPKSLYRRS